MKATTWLCPILTLLCATRLVCTAQRGYPLDYADSNMLQDDYLLEKRNKPSLSIVNPLDVLRQRLLLEIARRQMKENTRQVELNRAILKNVGKRMSTSTAMARQYQMLQHQLQQQQQQQPSEMNYAPAVSILDFLQRPVFDMLENDKKSLDIGTKHQLSGNEIGNETNRDGTSPLSGTSPSSSSGSSSNISDMNNLAVSGHSSEDEIDDDDIDNGRYQLRYLYRMHKNHLTRK